MGDAELADTYRKLPFANLHPHSAMIEQELSFRLVAALKEYSDAARGSAKHMEILTAVLVLLTVVLVVLTGVLLYTA